MFLRKSLIGVLTLDYVCELAPHCQTSEIERYLLTLGCSVNGVATDFDGVDNSGLENSVGGFSVDYWVANIDCAGRYCSLYDDALTFERRLSCNRNFTMVALIVNALNNKIVKIRQVVFGNAAEEKTHAFAFGRTIVQFLTLVNGINKRLHTFVKDYLITKMYHS